MKMKKLLVAFVVLGIILCGSAHAVAEASFQLNRELTGFRNELTGEVVYLGMTPEEVEKIAGIAYETRELGGIYKNWAIYEGGLMVYYRHNEQMPAVAMTVVPTLIDADDWFVFYYEGINEAYDSDENYGERIYGPGRHSIAVRMDTGEEISGGMLREDIEAITGAPLRESYIDYEYAYGDPYSEGISYEKTDELLLWENDKIVSKDVPGITLVDYEGISVGYRSIEKDGMTYSVAVDEFISSGRWYQPVNGIAMGDSGEEIMSLLGEYAEVREDEDHSQINAFFYIGEDGAKMVTSDEAKALLQAAGPVKNTENGWYEDLITVSYRLSEEGEISKIDIWDSLYTFFMQ